MDTQAISSMARGEISGILTELSLLAGLRRLVGAFLRPQALTGNHGDD